MTRAAWSFIAGAAGGLLVTVAWSTATRANHLEVVVAALGGFLVGLALRGDG